MGDLISRSALIEELRGLKTLYGTPMTMRDTQMIHWVIGHIKEQPTAYDVDAVVEQLEEHKKESHDDYLGLGCDDDFGAMCAYSHAIEIIKAGEV